MPVDVLAVLRESRSELQQQLDTVDAAIKILGGSKQGKTKTGRTVSAAAKRKMSLAAKKRWAAIKSKK
jgi:hypothetical protein